MNGSTHPELRPNPLFGTNKLKLGVFTFNGVGAITSDLPPREVSWPSMLRIAKLADDAGFEALIPYARWKGLPRPEPLPFVAHEVFEPFTWAAGLAQATRHSAIFATTHIPMVHPIVVAKMVATLDHISGGRFALNVVAGWNGPEFTMFGADLKEHEGRYAQAAEWLEILRRLWTEREFDYDGAFYQIVKGESFPKPLQQPYPPIMNAGGSDIGSAFAAKNADLCFVMAGSGDGDLEVASQQVTAYRQRAAALGRTIQVWTNIGVILRDTQAEAEAAARFFQEHSDAKAIEALMATRDAGSGAITLASGKQVKTLLASYQVVGNAERVNLEMKRIADAGFDGVVLVTGNFEDMLERWVRNVMPLMERDGLRAPMSGAD